MFLSWHRHHHINLRILRQRKLHPGLNPQLQLHLGIRLPPLHPRHLFRHPQRQSLHPVLLLHRLFKEGLCPLCLNGPLHQHYGPQLPPRKSLLPLLRVSPQRRLLAQNQPPFQPFPPLRRLALLRRQVRLVRVQALSSISTTRISMKSSA
jgi:hypothetical protein